MKSQNEKFFWSPPFFGYQYFFEKGPIQDIPNLYEYESKSLSFEYSYDVSHRLSIFCGLFRFGVDGVNREDVFKNLEISIQQRLEDHKNLVAKIIKNTELINKCLVIKV